MKTLVVVVVLLAPAIAHADREVSLGVASGLSMVGAPSAKTADVGALVAATAAWERGAPAVPADGVPVLRGELAPALTIARLGDRGAVLAGLRAAIHVAGRNRAGRDCRFSLWIGPDLGAVARADGLAWGGDIEIALYLGRSAWRLGLREAVLTWRDATPMALRSSAGGDGRQLAAIAGIVLTR